MCFLNLGQSSQVCDTAHGSRSNTFDVLVQSSLGCLQGWGLPRCSALGPFLFAQIQSLHLASLSVNAYVVPVLQLQKGTTMTLQQTGITVTLQQT